MVVEFTASGQGSTSIGLRCRDCGEEVNSMFTIAERGGHGLTGMLEQVTEATNVRISEVGKEHCLRCHGDGEIVGCIDDICHGRGRCMHDGNDVCPNCNRRCYLVHEDTADSGGEPA